MPPSAYSVASWFSKRSFARILEVIAPDSAVLIPLAAAKASARPSLDGCCRPEPLAPWFTGLATDACGKVPKYLAIS